MAIIKIGFAINVKNALLFFISIFDSYNISFFFGRYEL